MIINKMIEVEKKNLSLTEINEIKKQLTFNNPIYTQNEKRGYSNYKTNEFILCYKQNYNNIYLPKPFLPKLLEILGREVEIIDKRIKGEEQNFKFYGELRKYQKKATKDFKTREQGIIVAPCASGKTVMGLFLISQLRTTSLILVHKNYLLKQWSDAIEKFLDISKEDIGIIGGGKCIIKPITIGTNQTLSRRSSEYINNFGFIIQDEAHHVPAISFSSTITNFSPYYQLGLSATPYRKDGLTELIKLYIGSIIYSVSDEDLRKEGVKIKPSFVIRETDSQFLYKDDFNQLIDHLICDNARNDLIINDILYEAKKENYCLVFSDRVDHAKFLTANLQLKGGKATFMDAKDKKSQERIEKLLIEKKKNIVVCTGQLAGEGLDIPILNRLFITTPISGKARLTQYTGRILRTHALKKDAIVYDYLDKNIPICLGMYIARKKIYDQMT